MENPKKKIEFEAKTPDYFGDGVAVWINIDKNNHKYLKIKLTGHTTITAFQHIPKTNIKDHRQKSWQP